jgi:hypothetical protein
MPVGAAFSTEISLSPAAITTVANLPLTPLLDVESCRPDHSQSGLNTDDLECNICILLLCSFLAPNALMFTQDIGKEKLSIADHR